MSDEKPAVVRHFIRESDGEPLKEMDWRPRPIDNDNDNMVELAVRQAKQRERIALMDALDAFKYALMFTIDGSAAQRDGIIALSDSQQHAIRQVVPWFKAWRKQQDARVSLHTCGEQLEVTDPVDGAVIEDEFETCSDPAYAQCMTCGGYFCDMCFIDHLEMSMEEIGGESVETV